ncbi:MAG: hypothetical protein JW995_13395 [Melioribacteraceae bacterium]|nr:hypothetical protein [Melioribacteraceae bacterium]
MTSHPEDSSKYRVYKVSKNDTPDSNIHLREYPVQWGVPVTNNSNVIVFDDQMIWTVYNALDSSSVMPTGNNRRMHKHFPPEVHQVMYGFRDAIKDISFPDDVIFMEYTVINKGDYSIDSSFIGLWADIDFDNLNDYPAIDTINQLRYCWNENNFLQDSFSPRQRLCTAVRTFISCYRRKAT